MQCFAFMKSSIHRKSLMLTNAVGIVDFGYRGEITFKFKSLNSLIGEGIDYFDIKEWVSMDGGEAPEAEAEEAPAGGRRRRAVA